MPALADAPSHRSAPSPASDPDAPPSPGLARALLLLAGPGVYALAFALAPSSLPTDARHVLGIAAWMALWWLTEVVPLAATSLLPLGLFPLLGVASARDAAAPYANELVFLYLGGFFLAAALEQWRAHERLAFGILGAIGTGSRRIVLGVMVATAFVSMWISNTATAAMMYPIALAIGRLAPEGRDGGNLRTALMLGVAYAASIGGMATLVGTPPNLIFAGAARELAGTNVDFVRFMMVGLPAAAVLLPLCWAMLVFVLHPSRSPLGHGADALVHERRVALGPLVGGERRVLAVFALTALAWLLREPKDFGAFTVPGLTTLAPGVTDASLGVLAAVLLFALPGRTPEGTRRPLLTWREARGIPWDALLLFGGGLSLAAAMESSGLARWLGGLMQGLAGAPSLLIFAGLAVLVLVLSEIGSNTAVATIAMPLAASLAAAVGQPPVVLMLVAALAASAGFALPIATPPNTIVFGSGYVSVRQMARAGILLDLLAILVVVATVWLIAPLAGFR
ncbi:MAG TPA: SLC13 family permease [Gemmatimonadaceae bacterium]|nr:SLC13 family permease [Gemmatimonadaceae bacterium]